VPGLLALFVGVALSQAPGAGAPAFDRPTETLLKSLPNDAVAVLVVDRLGDHLEGWQTSGFWKRAQALPTFQAWLASDEHAQIERSVAMAEGLLGLKLREVIESLLGEAVVLSLHPDSQVEGGNAGLVLLRVRDVDMLRRVVKRLETTNPAGGPPLEVRERSEGTRTYKVRIPQRGGRASDAFAMLDDGRFAWSNSEAVIQAFLNRSGGDAALEIPEWIAENRKALPARSFLEIHVSDRLWRQPGLRPSRDDAEPSSSSFGKRLQRWALSCVGFGLALSDEAGLKLHMVERFSSPAGAEPLLAFLAEAPDLPDLSEADLPGDLVAHAALSFDARRLGGQLLDAAGELAPARVRNTELLVSGILDEPAALRAIVSRLGPQARVRLNAAPERRAGSLLERGLELVVAFEFQGEGRTAAQLRRLVQTLLALVALDARNDKAGRPLRIEEGDGGTTLVLALAETAITVRIGERWCVVGTAEGQVRSWSDLLNRQAGESPARGESSIKAYAEFFAGPLRTWLNRDREHWIQESSRSNGLPPEQAAREFDQALDLLSLLDRIRLVIRVSRDARLFSQEISIIPAEDH
jgi:hypothetical protein